MLLWSDKGLGVGDSFRTVSPLSCVSPYQFPLVGEMEANLAPLRLARKENPCHLLTDRLRIPFAKQVSPVLSALFSDMFVVRGFRVTLVSRCWKVASVFFSASFKCLVLCVWPALIDSDRGQTKPWKCCPWESACLVVLREKNLLLILRYACVGVPETLPLLVK